MNLLHPNVYRGMLARPERLRELVRGKPGSRVTRNPFHDVGTKFFRTRHINLILLGYNTVRTNVESVHPPRPRYWITAMTDVDDPMVAMPMHTGGEESPLGRSRQREIG